ncbi:MAG: hypothetical protein FGF52_05820 [Candidatus Brockarchaeota archaeon]|nr:hypothetical protein [Candidatus Brockarchaeota archaeon]
MDEERKMTSNVATVWGWGDRFEDVRTNCEKYVNKRWKETTKECLVYFSGRERDEGIGLDIAVYVSDKRKVGDLAERMFNSMVFAGNAKVYSISIQLFEDVFSNNEVYRRSMEEIEKELEEREKIIAGRFINDPKVKQVAEGRKVTFIPQINLMCEIESGCSNKIVMELIHEDFDKVKELLSNLSEELIDKGLAKRILGYELGRSVDELKVGDIDFWDDEVLVWLF